jgi:hypothetical protein
MTPDLEKHSFSSHHVDEVFQVVWSWGLWFGLFPSYNVFVLRGAMTLSLKSRVIPLNMLITRKCTKLYDAEAYSSVFILPARFFY